MHEIWASENAKPQDSYGKVVDQSGQPIEGAIITGYLHFIVGMDADRMEKHLTTTDSNGDFELTGLKGEHLGAMPTKPGYIFKSGSDSYRLPTNGQKTSRDNRAVYIMWKLQGAEPMVHAKVHAYVPCDGTATSYDILTGHKAANGDLVLTLTRTPVDIERGRPFDWKATVELPSGGGVIPINETYPNEAPAEGYEPKLTIEMPKSMKGWDAAFERSYYFKNGKVYGRMTVSIQADFQPPPTSLDVEIYANPSGSPAAEISNLIRRRRSSRSSESSLARAMSARFTYPPCCRATAQ